MAPYVYILAVRLGSAKQEINLTWPYPIQKMSSFYKVFDHSWRLAPCLAKIWISYEAYD